MQASQLTRPDREVKPAESRRPRQVDRNPSTCSLHHMRMAISAGEASGRAILGLFARELARIDPGCEVFGLQDAAEIEPVFGFAEGLRVRQRLRGALDRIEASVRKLAPDVAVLVSFSGLHLPLGRRLRQNGVPVLYIGPPQVWAWGGWRTRQLRLAADKVVCLFRFEHELLSRSGVDAEYFGYPLLDGVVSSMSREQTLEVLGFDHDDRYVAFLPGSRPAEIEYHEPLFQLVYERLRRESRDIRGVIVRPEQQSGAKGDHVGGGIATTSRHRYDVMGHAECACAVSGTVTAELAILGVPMVVSYHLSRTSRVLARALVRTRHFALPNILDGTRLVPELLEPEPESLACLLRSLTGDSALRRSQTAGLARVVARLGPPGAMRRVCALALEMGGNSSTRRRAGRPARS